jgi:hypothetical protein
MKSKECSVCEIQFNWEGHKTNSTLCSSECKYISRQITLIKYKESLSPEKIEKQRQYDNWYNNTLTRKKYMKKYRTTEKGKQSETLGKVKYRKQKKNREVERNGRLKRIYNITIEDYNIMLINQKEVCAICNEKETKVHKDGSKRLAVDHCHTTGKVRGLLCFACNSSIGKLKESIPTLENAIKYLKAHK